MKSNLHNISTIIFDLGGVVLNLNPNLTIQSFSKHSGLSEKEVMDKFEKGSWPKEFERGKITAVSFRNAVRDNLDLNLSDDHIDESWNRMLLDLPLARLELLSSIRKDFNTLILSNTNEIHIKAFNNIVTNTTGGKSIEDFFNKVYYSHELGMRKPDQEIFNQVLLLNDLNPSETLFIDDMEDNIVGAANVGLQTLHLTNQNFLEELFS